MTLAELQQDQTFRALLIQGFMYPKINQHIEIYLYYKAKRIAGIDKSIAITWTADQFKRSEVTIYSVIKKIKAVEESIK